MSTSDCGQITPPTLPPDQYPFTLSLTTLMGPVCNWQNRQIRPGRLSVFVNSFVNKFVVLLPTADFGDSNGILNNAAPVNPTDGTPLLRRSLFNDSEEEMWLFAMGAVNKLVALGVNIASFPVVVDASCT
jgi:hypothetical protein